MLGIQVAAHRRSPPDAGEVSWVAKRPSHASRFQFWTLERVVTGVYSYPSANELETLAAAEAGESQAQGRRRLLGQFADAAADTDRRAGAILTGAGFALAINGVLLSSGPVSRTILFLLAIPALIAFVVGLFSFQFWVEQAPRAEEDPDNLVDALNVCVIKQFWTVIASTMVSISLGGYGVSLAYLAFS